MRLLGVAVILTAVAVVSGLAAYEWRSPAEPVRIEPVELLPAPEREPRRELPGKRGRAAEQADTRVGGAPPAPSSTEDGAAPVPPAPAPAGDDDDDGRDDDDGADNGGDD